jgi:zinc transport system ATP-binding protein
MADTFPLIQLKDVSFMRNNEPVLDHISLNIEAGEYVGVIGPNGGGKTTLLRIMLGLIKPTAGQVKLVGASPDRFRDWWKIGYVPQKAASFDARFPITVEEVVMLGRVSKLGIGRRPSSTDRQAVSQALEQVDMAGYRHRLITELSGGQQQRVFIAKALAAGPQVLILDEPAVGIDVKSQDRFYQLLSNLNKQSGLTLVMVSHDIDVVVNEVTKIACINETLVYHGSPKDFMKDDYMAQLYGKARKFILHGH